MNFIELNEIRARKFSHFIRELMRIKMLKNNNLCFYQFVYVFF